MAKFDPKKKQQSGKKSVPVGDDFTRAMSRHASAFDEAKTTTATEGFPDATQTAEALGLEAGSTQRRVAKVKEVKVGVDQKGNPYLVFDFSITRGQGKGTVVSIFHSIKDGKKRPDGSQVTVKDVIERICQNFQRLGYETENLKVQELAGLAESATKDHAVVQVRIKYDGEYLNTYLVKMLEEENEDTEESEEEESEEEETEDVSDDDGDEESEEEEDDSEGDDSEESEDEDETEDEEDEEELAKGVEVLYQAKGSRKPEPCEVLAVSEDKETVNLLRKRDKKKFVGISASEVELVYED